MLISCFKIEKTLESVKIQAEVAGNANSMTIQREETGNKGEFFIEKDDKKIALMTYSKSGADKIIIDHTEVDASLKGKGIGGDLVAEGVKYARENNLKIIPWCPFAKTEFEKHADYADVLAD